MARSTKPIAGTKQLLLYQGFIVNIELQRSLTDSEWRILMRYPMTFRGKMMTNADDGK